LEDDVVFREDDFFRGTLPPSRRASERPMAMACLRLVTFLPDRPERSLPCLRSRIARSTFFPAFFPYLAMEPPASEPARADPLKKRKAPADVTPPELSATLVVKLYSDPS